MRLLSAFGPVLSVCALLASTIPAPAAADPATAADCPFHVAPAKAVDESEAVRPGATTPAPLPVPAQPVGGAGMGRCGVSVPAGAPAPPKDVTTDSWVVADLDSGAVLAARNPHARLRPASLIKTLLALVVVRDLDLAKKVVGTQEDADQEGTRVGVGPGGKYTVGLLLKVLLMRSGNDAAHALAVQLGGVPQTVAKMNALAHDLGALDTRTATPSGLDGPGMCTSAYDLAVFFRAGLRNPAIAQAVATKRVQFPGYAEHPGFTVVNDNRLLGVYPGFLGGKTGFTDDARHTYLGGAQHGAHRLEVVLMHGEQHPVRMAEQGAHLFDWGFGLLGKQPVGQLVDNAPAPPTGAQPTGSTAPPQPGGGVQAATPASSSGSSFAAIGLPVLAAVVVAAGIVVLLWRRRRSAAPAAQGPVEPEDPAEQTRPIS